MAAKNRIDRVGHVYGHLTVIEYSHTYKKRAYWKCQCACGNYITVPVCNLLRNHTQSCGCGGYGSGESRFWSRVNKRSNDECWEWQYTKSQNGYGQFTHKGQSKNAHRWAYIFTFGDTGKLHVCHTCDNKLCCNPNHLFLGTNQDNMKDRNVKNRQASGERSGRAKITWQDVREIRHLRKTLLLSYSELGKRYHLDPSTIGHIIRNETWIE